MSSNEPLTAGVDCQSYQYPAASEEHKMPPQRCISSQDSNENVQSQCNYETVKSKCSDETGKLQSDHEKIVQEKKFDFLVWHHHCNKSQADQIYTNLEALNLCGYIPERDRVLGQYKLTAMEAAIKNTANIILLLSKEALSCQEFHRKMHATITSSQSSVIPIYVGMRKAEGPRLLRHHVDIQFQNDKALWLRLHSSISRPKMAVEKPCDMLVPFKPSKKEAVPSVSSSPPTRNRTSRPITVVPARDRAETRPKRTAKTQTRGAAKSSEGVKGWPLPFLRKKKQSEETPGIQMEVMTTKKDR